MRSKIAYVTAILTSILLLSVFGVLPGNAFIYPNETTDAKYEKFGPHADQIFMKMYEGEVASWTGLQAGEVDIVDWPLDVAWRGTFQTDPNVNVIFAGGEAGMYIIDFNYNPNPLMGIPPTGRPNPVYDATNNIPPVSNNDFFRVGCGHLFNRTQYNLVIGAAGTMILSPIPSYMGGWIWPGLTGYTFSRTEAEASFAAGKIKQSKTVLTDGHWTRYWDRNNNDVIDAGEKEACVLRMTWRMDTARRTAGEMLYQELTAMNFTFNALLSGPRTSGQNYQQVMLDKNYHITTLGWINMGPDPDFLYDLYHISAYFDDPEANSPNSAGLNDTFLNTYSEGIKFAVDSAMAKDNAYLFQERFELICAQIPLYSPARYMASRKYYSGGNAETITSPDDGENNYRRVGGTSSGAKREWFSLCNTQGRGSNNFWSMLNMYPNGTSYGTGNMTIRYGWKEKAHPKYINCFYASWYWDAEVLGEIYDGLGYRDPYDLSTWKPYLVKTWSTGTWEDATAPAGERTKSKVKITLRPDIKWQDGTPMTVADVVFSLVEAGQMMEAGGYAPPWWWPTGELVRSMSIVDAYTVEILYDVVSYLVESWTLGGFYIIPKHIWKPIIESGDPVSFAPDPNVVGSGPYRFLTWTPTSSLVLVANKPGSTVTTTEPGAVPTTSPGVFLYTPVHVDVHANDYKVKFAPGTDITLTVALTNEWANQLSGSTVNVDKTISIKYPNATVVTTGPTNVNLQRAADGTITPHIETLIRTLPKGTTEVKVSVLVNTAPWNGKFVNATMYLYGTIAEDIGGTTLYDTLGLGTYPFKTQLPTPDAKVDMKDIGAAAKAFGSSPGHPRWNSVADINSDYKVDMKDIGAIAKKFGF